MEIHRFEKLWLVLSLVLILGFIGTITYGAIGPGITMVSDSGGTIDVDNLDNTEFADPGVTKTGPDSYEVHVVARQFLFNPGTSEPIRVPADSNVTFYVTSADVVHGFEIANTNVNTMVIPGQVAELTVEFDDPAKYGLICHEYCGAGHHTMEGIVRVVPQSQFNSTEAQA
jgi:cytochrome c oxidase subunit 2